MKVTTGIKDTIDTEVSNDATIGVHTDALPGPRDGLSTTRLPSHLLARLAAG
jgi:hypothetical protein